MNIVILKLFYSFATLFNLMPQCLTIAESSGLSSRSADEDRCNRTVEIYQAVSGPAVTEFNRGKPLHCTYRIRVRPARDDWIIFVRFTRLRVGEPSDDRQKCIGGYVQIVDGYRDSNYSNREHSGYYCGEIDMPKTFISETPYIKIVFHADHYEHDTYIQFDANVEQQVSMYTRYGQFHQLYPNRRGIPVPGTYCERTYPDCRPGPRCFVQSPGYPGIYSRNLRCRYHLNARQSLVGLELSAFDVDGQACDNLLMCFPRPVSTKENECPFDYVRIYDGPDENSPIIATLCGKGRIKSSIISSTSNMLVEFVTSPAGPLLSTGFHFKADAIIDTGNSESIQLSNGSCIIERQLSDANVPHLFTNIRSWYPSNTTCVYKFTTHDTKDLISLEFLRFRVERVTLCQESLRIFDGLEADDMSTLMTRLCDMNKPQSGASKTTYITSGPALVVQFSSLIGSLDGSSLNYEFDVRLIPPQNEHDLNDISKSCSKHITQAPDALTSGSVSWNLEEFNKSQSSPIQCNLTFDASSLQHGRVNVSMYSPFLLTNCNECNESRLGRIVVYRNIDIAHPMQSLCYCKSSRSMDTSYVISSGAQMIISLQLPAEWGAQLHHSSPIQVIYRFFSDTRCGLKEILTPQLQGVVNFPFNSDMNEDNKLIKVSSYMSQAASSLSSNTKSEPVFCSWKLPLFPQLDVAFTVEHMNCTTDFLLVKDMQICPHSTSAQPMQNAQQNHNRRDIIIKSDDISSLPESVPRNSYSNNVVTIYYGSTNPTNSTLLVLKYTQLKLLLPISSGDQLVPMGRNCEFLCTNPPACLKQELVCNGVPNCPGLGLGGRKGEDEDEAICKRTNYWSLLMKESTTLLAVASAGFLMLCFITFVSICICRRMRKKRQRF